MKPPTDDFQALVKGLPPLWDSGEKPPDCVGCPYAGRRTPTAHQFVAGHGEPDAELWGLGEAPGRNELDRGGPFDPDAPSGRIVTQGFGGRHRLFVTNVRKCLPPEKEDVHDKEKSINHCTAAYLDKEIAAFGQRLTHIACIGGEAFGAVTGLDRIAKWHGSIFNRGEIEAIRAVSGTVTRADSDEDGDELEEEADDVPSV